MNRISTIVTVFLVCSLHARADICLWSGTSANVAIDDFSGTITILAAGTFKFQSVTGGSLDAINHVFVADGVTGTVIIHVARNPADGAGTNGATDVGSINLTNSHATPLIGNLAELRITGDLGTASNTVLRNVTGVP